MNAAAIRVARLAGAVGAEISGIDLREPLPAEQRAAVRRIWLENGVVFLRDQQLTPEDEELTPTMKLKRSFVNQKYAKEIEAMYRD